MTVNKFIGQIESFKGKTIALTGGTSGVGRALLDILLIKEANVILLARTGMHLDEIKEKYKSIEVLDYDQSSYQSIDNAIKKLLDRHPPIDYIVLDAGNLGVKDICDNGYPGTIGVNYIGARYFIDTISPLLKNKVRFVIQGSIVAGLPLKKKKDLYKVRGLFPQYNISKAYLEAYIYKLISENKYPNIEYVITEPGVTSTNIIRNLNPIVRFLGKYFLKIFFHSPKKASLCLLTGLSNKSKNGDWVVPRGLFTLSGYPKIKDLPLKRRRPYLFK